MGTAAERWKMRDDDWSFDPPRHEGTYRMRHVLDGEQFGQIVEVHVTDQVFGRFDTIQWAKK